ncbi:MAG TPA: hypothetical protein VD926_12565 [Acidimicrobiales bacterium]|nr:hypothetical protein [Acidimicrobiales bacterium]
MKRHLLLPLLAAAALLLAACGDDSSSDEASDASAAPTADTTGSSGASPEYGGGGGGPTGTTAAPASDEATVSVAEVGPVGEALVGPDGRTLYLFDQDDGTTTACTGGCADVWPALSVEGEPTAGEGVDPSLLSTAEGQVPGHVAYNGHLLYHFASDAAPGDANGVGIPGWFPVDAAGNAIEAG